VSGRRERRGAPGADPGSVSRRRQPATGAEGGIALEPNGETIRVMVVDDHAVVREGLRTLLSRLPDLEVVAQAGTVEEAVAAAREAVPSVIVMDVRLPDGSGVDACRTIRSEHPECRVVMLTSYADEEAIVSSIMAGASGYLLKDATPDTLVSAIRTVHRGGSLLDPQVATAVLSRMRQGSAATDPWSTLTGQEREVLERVAKGETNRQIAIDLHLSEKTVKHYVSNILDKIGADNRAAAAAWLVRRQMARTEA
jgi:two-component system response regulator DevR